MGSHVFVMQGTQCLTGFHGMDFTRDKLCSLIKKWHSLIEAFVDVKTTDGYHLRMVRECGVYLKCVECPNGRWTGWPSPL